MKRYLAILKESLIKKIDLLGRVIVYDENQYRALTGENVNMDDFDTYAREKDALILEMEQLDEGFEALYQRISQELNQNRSQYSDEIKELKVLVAKVTDAIVHVQTQEKRNKAAVEQYFAGQKRNVAESRRNAAAAMNYYRSQSNAYMGTSVFIDDKK